MENTDSKKKSRKSYYVIAFAAVSIAAAAFFAYRYMPLIKGYAAGMLIKNVFGNLAQKDSLPYSNSDFNVYPEQEKTVPDLPAGNRQNFNAQNSEPQSSVGSLGMITVPEELLPPSGTGSGENAAQSSFDVPANGDYRAEKLQNLSVLMKHPLYQQFSKEYC